MLAANTRPGGSRPQQAYKTEAGVKLNKGISRLSLLACAGYALAGTTAGQMLTAARDSVERIELRMAAGGDNGIPSALLATTILWIRDVAGFSQKLSANAIAINKDLDDLAKGNRIAQVDRIAVTLGEGQPQIPADAHVFSFFYRSAYDQRSGSVFSEVAKDGGQFLQGFVPMLADLRLTAIA